MKVIQNFNKQHLTWGEGWNEGVGTSKPVFGITRVKLEEKRSMFEGIQVELFY